MATYYNTKETYGSPEQAANQALQKQVGTLISNPGKRDIPANLVPQFYEGKMSLEDLTSAINGTPTYDAAKGPQINFGSGNTAYQGTLDPKAYGAAGAPVAQVPDGGTSSGVRTPSVPGFVTGNATPVNVTAAGTQIGGGAVTPFTPEQKQQNQDIQTRYQQAMAKTAGQPLPATGPEASQAAKNLVPPENKAPVIPASIDTSLQTNPVVGQTQQSLQDYFSPPAVQQQITEHMQKIAAEQAVLATQKAQYMNMQNIIAGTAENIRSEVVAANGFATESQVQALAISRNKVLQTQMTQLQNMMQMQQDAIATDTSLLANEKEMANQQFNQRLGVAKFYQDAIQNSQTALKESGKYIQDTIGYDGLYKAMLLNPEEIPQYERTHGLPPGGLKIAADAAALQRKQETTKANLQNSLIQLEITKNNQAKQAEAIANVDVPTVIAKISNKNESRTELGGMSVNGLVQKAQTYLTNGGNIQGLGLSNTGAAGSQRTLIANYAGYLADQMGMTVPQITAAYKANSKAATDVTSRIAKIDTTSATLTQQFPRLVQLADRVGNLGITESDLTAGKAAVARKFGSTDAANYVELLQTIRGDYAAMQAAIGGSRGGEFFSRTAQDAIPLGLTAEQYQGIQQTIDNSARIAQSAAGDEINKLLGMSGGVQSTQAKDGDTKVYNGVTYKVVNGQWVSQ